MDPVNIPAKFEVGSFTRSWDNSGYSKFGPSLDTPTIPFLQNFSWACVRMYPMNIPATFEVPSFSRSWDNSEPQSRGSGGRMESGMVPFERAFVTSYRPSIVTFRDVATFVLQHATSSYPTSSLPKFPHVPLGVGGWPLGYEERRCWSNWPCS